MITKNYTITIYHENNSKDAQECVAQVRSHLMPRIRTIVETEMDCHAGMMAEVTRTHINFSAFDGKYHELLKAMRNIYRQVDSEMAQGLNELMEIDAEFAAGYSLGIA